MRMGRPLCWPRSQKWPCSSYPHGHRLQDGAVVDDHAGQAGGGAGDLGSLPVDHKPHGGAGHRPRRRRHQHGSATGRRRRHHDGCRRTQKPAAGLHKGQGRHAGRVWTGGGQRRRLGCGDDPPGGVPGDEAHLDGIAHKGRQADGDKFTGRQWRWRATARPIVVDKAAQPVGAPRLGLGITDPDIAAPRPHNADLVDAAFGVAGAAKHRHAAPFKIVRSADVVAIVRLVTDGDGYVGCGVLARGFARVQISH